jgi:hypothetical protein
MADYYELIAKAVASLDPDGSSVRRQALYDRAQAALVDRLRSATPPFTEAVITGERLALEEAVRRVEEEALRRHDAADRPPFRDYLTAFSDLMMDADKVDETPAETSRRHYLLQANALEIGRIANPSSLNSEAPMVVTGVATGFLGRIWRWRQVR